MTTVNFSRELGVRTMPFFYASRPSVDSSPQVDNVDGQVVREEQRDAGGRPDHVTGHRRVRRPLIITPLP